MVGRLKNFCSATLETKGANQNVCYIMSGRAPKETDRLSEQSMFPYQLIWMAHWRQACCRSAGQGQTFPSCQHEVRGKDNNRDHLLLGQLEKPSDFAKSTEEIKQVTQDKGADMADRSLKNCSKGSISEKIIQQSFPIFSLPTSRKITSGSETQETSYFNEQVRSKIGHDSDTIASGSNGCRIPSVLARASIETKLLPGNPHLQCKNTSENPESRVKFHRFFEKNFASSSSFLDNHMRSASTAMPYKFNSRGASMPSLISGQRLSQSASVIASGDCLSNANIVHIQHEHHNYHSYSEFMVHEKKTDNCLEALDLEKFGKSLVKESDRAKISHAFSLGNEHLLLYGGEQFQEMHNCSEDGSQFKKDPQETKISQRKNRQSNLGQGLKISFHDVQTMRLSTMAPPTVFQTAHDFSIKEKTDIDLSKRCKILCGSSKFEGNMLCESFSPSPHFCCNRHQGVNQLLRSFKDDKGKENIKDTGSTPAGAVNMSGKSSTETASMDIGVFLEDKNSDEALSSASCKDLKGCKLEPLLQVVASSIGKVVPDINLEFPGFPTSPSSRAMMEPSASTTQSLDVENLPSQNDQPETSKLSPCREKYEPSTRWVKRLKLNLADSVGHGTKSSKTGEVLFPEKVKFSRNILRSQTDPDPTTDNRNGNERKLLDRAELLSSKGESASMGIKKEDITLSNSWIQRWCKERSPLLRKPWPLMIGSVMRSSRVLGEFPREQSPSIAAMALLGKAMNVLRTREFENRGPFVVWNMEGVV